MTDIELNELRDLVSSCVLAKELIKDRQEFVRYLESGYTPEIRIHREGTSPLIAILTDVDKKFIHKWLLNSQKIALAEAEREFRERGVCK